MPKHNWTTEEDKKLQGFLDSELTPSTIKKQKSFENLTSVVIANRCSKLKREKKLKMEETKVEPKDKSKMIFKKKF